MLRLASDVVATTTGRIQQHAAAVILETARCTSGPVSANDGPVSASVSTTDDGVPGCTDASAGAEPGCTSAGLDEVSVLLDALQSPSVALREVSIQVCFYC